MIQREYDYEISTVIFWSDSSAVIGQIRGLSKRLPSLPPTDFVKFWKLQNQSNGAIVQANLIQPMMPIVG